VKLNPLLAQSRTARIILNQISETFRDSQRMSAAASSDSRFSVWFPTFRQQEAAKAQRQSEIRINQPHKDSSRMRDPADTDRGALLRRVGIR
jgi:hypothetical protein